MSDTLLAKPEVIERLYLEMPQVECPVVHHFGPGVYIREIHMPKGIVALGHHQRFDHLNVMLRGKVAMICDDDVVRVVQAPYIYTGKPGRKFGYVMEDVVWQNVYPNPTDTRDVAALEGHFLDKSPTAKIWEDDLFAMQQTARQEDRDDYAALDVAFPVFKAYQELPESFSSRLTFRKSPIDGMGVFSSAPFGAFEIIAPIRVGKKATKAAQFVNHSKQPNAFFAKNDFDDIYMLALKPVRGCIAGDWGEEITVDYHQAVGVFEDEQNLKLEI